jgi:uncharacterized Zn finger protein
MPCKDNCNGANQEIAVCNTVFKYNLIPVDTNTHVVCVSRCSTPTATFEIAKRTGLVEVGDTIIVTGSSAIGIGSTDMMQIITVK